MTFSIKKTTTLAMMIFSLGLNTAHAADWIEKVQVKKGGIDLQPINIRSNNIKYTTAVQTTHDFAIDVYARAKSGKRIWYAQLSSQAIPVWAPGIPGPAIPESDAFLTDEYMGREVAAGTKRTWNRDITYRINLNRVLWDGPDPGQACNELLAKKLLQGQARAAILSQVQNTKAEATFYLRAAAARTAKAADLGGESRTVFNTNHGHWTDESAGTRYSVDVRCLPSPNQENQVQPPQSEQPETQPNTVTYERKKKPGEKLLKILPVVIGIGLLIAGGGSSGKSGR